MTIDSNNTVRATNSIKKIFNEPPNIVNSASRTGQFAHDERLFLYPKFNMDRNCKDTIEPKKPSDNDRKFQSIDRPGGLENRRKIQPELYKKLPKCLAFKAKIYYNNELYVVGPRFMQGVAKLRNVAEVFITDFIYLKLPHIANSKRTIVAK